MITLARVVIPGTVLAGVVLGIMAAPVAGQEPDECRRVFHTIYREIHGDTVRTGLHPCETLSAFLTLQSDPARTAASLLLEPDDANPAELLGRRAFQDRHPQHASLSGTPGQTDAIPSVRPAAVASGSIAVVGTDAGDDALAALGLNPAMLFVADAVTEELARLSRFMDLSVLVPVTRQEGDTGTREGLEYFGIRIRMNFHGLSAGSQLWERADALMRTWIQARAADQIRIEEILADAPSLEGCARVLLADDAQGARRHCGRTLELTVPDAEVRALRDQFERIRRAADSRYFGADIRLDFGDPTLGAVEDAAMTALFGGIAYGRRYDFPTGGGRAGFRARLGVRHASLRNPETTQLAGEGGFGFELARAFEEQEVSAAAAVEGRWGRDTGGLARPFQTNFAVARASLIIPVTRANSISMAVSVPIVGAVSSFLTVNFNWGLLLPEGP